MNRFLLICLLGALHVMGLRKFAGEECSKVAFLIDVSESVRVGPDGYEGPGYLPDIRNGLKAFTQSENLPACACILVQLITFASQARIITTTGYVTPADAQVYIDNLDYQINPVCDDIDRYSNLTNLTPTQIQECRNPTYFQEQAVSFSNACRRGSCQKIFADQFCGTYPRCGFTNYEEAFNAAYDVAPNYAIIITDGDPTIKITDLDDSAGYPKCAGQNPGAYDAACLSSFCPQGTDCTDVEDREAGRDAADRLKQFDDLNTKVIAISRTDFVSPQGIDDLYRIASCPNDPPTPGPTTCTDMSKTDTTVYIAPDYASGLEDSLLSIPRLAICNTMSPTTISPTRGPTNSPTFIVSRAPSPSTCCTCSPTQSQGLDTLSPTPAKCVAGACAEGCICLDVANITAVTEFPLPDICYDALCLDACVNVTLFGPTPETTSQPTRAPTTRQPTRRRNIFLWLLPFLLGLSGRGGAGLAPQGATTVVDVYHVIHGGRRLLAACGTTNAACPKPIDKWRCVSGTCVALPACSRTNPNCTSTTYCDYALSVCRSKAIVGETCVPNNQGVLLGARTCLDGLFCFSNPSRPELPARCASVQCLACCPCGGLGTRRDGEVEVPITCSPTPALAPIVFGTKRPTARTPTRKIVFNPWLLLFLFPQLGGLGRYPISQPRPGGTVVVDIWHIIHARQALFNASADNKECVGIKSNHQWLSTNGVVISTCDNFVMTPAQCCALCKEAPSCLAWEMDARPVAESHCLANPYPGERFPCRLISGPGFVSSGSEAVAGAITIGFISQRPVGPQPCSTTADCTWNPGAFPTDEGDGRQYCTDLGGLAASECRTICSSDNTCVRALGEDTCFKEAGPTGLLGEYGFCVAGFTNCLCDPAKCDPPPGWVFNPALGGFVPPGGSRRLLFSVFIRPAFCCDQVTESGDIQCCGLVE